MASPSGNPPSGNPLSGNPRKRKSLPSDIPPVVEDKRPRVSNIGAQETQVPLPEAVSPTQSSQSSATAHMRSQKNCLIDDRLKKAKEKLMNIKEQVEATIKMLDDAPEPSGGRQEGPKKPKRPPSPKGTAKAFKKTMAANQTITMNHRETQGAPSSLQGTEKELLDDLVRSQPGFIFHDKETRIRGIILCLAILQKVECDPIEFLENMKVITQLLGHGSHKFQPTRILYLNLDKIDKYAFPLFHEVDVH